MGQCAVQEQKKGTHKNKVQKQTEVYDKLALVKVEFQIRGQIRIIHSTDAERITG